MSKLTSYPGDVYYVIRGKRYYVRTGEKRPPRKGEWYLSGAIPQAYQAPNDLNSAYHILSPVKRGTQKECFDGCDAAGIVEPGKLAELMRWLRSYKIDGCDHPDSYLEDCGTCTSCKLRAALRAVRGE